jgi:phage terminase small subunit
MKFPEIVKMKIPKVPNGLQSHGKKFFKKVLSEYVLTEGHDLERLFMGCRCLDEIAEAEEIVKKEGRFITDRFLQRKEHPASRAIRDNKTLFCRIIRELGLDISSPADSRPPRQY